MRQNPNTRRSRGRSGGGGGGGGGRKPGNTRNQIFDSNGPGARVRGNSAQIYEKYQQLARDASSSGDRVSAEGFYQHAEHYYRLMEAAGLNRDGTPLDQPQQQNDAAAHNVAQNGTAVEAAETASEAVGQGAAVFTEAAGEVNSQQHDQAPPEATNGSGNSEEEARPVRRTRARRPNGSANVGSKPNVESKPNKDADTAASEEGSDTPNDDNEPVSA